MKLTIEQYIREAAVEQARSSFTPDFNLGRYLDHWSPSSFAMLHRCPYQWQQRYIHGRRERPGEAPVIGTSVHAAVERNMGQKILSFEDLPTNELLEWFDDVGFADVVAREQESKGEVVWDSGPETARARGRKMLSEYHGRVAPRVQPTGVEGMFSETIFGLPIPVQGRFDIERDTSVIDLKTGKRKQSKPKESWRIQAAVYGEVMGKPVEFHHVSASSSGAVTIVTPLEEESLFVQPTPTEREQLAIGLRTLSAMACMYMEIFGPDEAWPTLGRFHDWACSYCGFREGCPAWAE